MHNRFARRDSFVPSICQTTRFHKLRGELELSKRRGESRAGLTGAEGDDPNEREIPVRDPSPLPLEAVDLAPGTVGVISFLEQRDGVAALGPLRHG